MKKALEILKKNPMLIALVFVMLFFHIWIVMTGRGSLFAPRNITNLISQNGYVIILATGMLLCILTGGNIDLSVGSMVCLVAALGATLIVKWNNNFLGIQGNVYTSIALCLLLGILLGAIQAYWIAYVRIPAFIVTLAGMLAYRGLALILLNAQTISPMPADFTGYFGSFLPGASSAGARLQISLITGAIICAVVVAVQLYSRVSKIRKNYDVEDVRWMWARLVVICAVIIGSFYSFGKDRGIPVVLILLGVVVLTYYYYTAKTVPGRYLYAMGGNEKAAKLSGINTNGVLFFAYANMGFLAAVAALVCMARFNSAFPTLGQSYELDAIGACFIGGASAYGGIGTVGGTLIGTVFMGVLNNGMSILGINANWQQVVKGTVLLTAVVFDVLSKKRKGGA